MADAVYVVDIENALDVEVDVMRVKMSDVEVLRC